MHFDRTPTNPNNYIWSTYLRRPTIEDRILQGVVIAVLGGVIMLAWKAVASCFCKASAPSSLKDNSQDDLFKNW